MADRRLTRRQVLVAGASAATSLAASRFSFSLGAPEYDVVILNGRVIDPESKLDSVRNIGILGQSIDAISTHKLKGARTIDARGLIVAPGFIDPISHGQDLENDRL